MRNLRILITFLLLSSYCYSSLSVDCTDLPGNPTFLSEKKELELANNLFEERKYPEAIATYKIIIKKEEKPLADIYKKVAQGYSALNKVEQSINYIEEYLQADFNTDILADSWFDGIRQTPQFLAVTKKYTPKSSIWSFMYLYVALIGFYIAIVIHFNRKVDLVARILISSFIFIHSFFILHIWLKTTNYNYEFPHSYLMSTCFSFLYGPLLYFYFKKITQRHVFKIKDLAHLIPTALFLIYILPIYSLSSGEKLELMLARTASSQNPGDSINIIIIVILKFISLAVYGFFIRKLYVASKNQKEGLTKENRLWQRNIFIIHMAYIVCYAGYGILISHNILSGFLFHSQVICMALMVMYIGYCANVQPNVFNGSASFDKLFFKYEKSGLTTSLSQELKENMIRLFDVEKIFKENDISLEKLANRLNTTRHNASQVINEHFHMNFHELINKYRINEAKKIFEKDNQRNLNIIDVAYEVGYNNKVTFNKAFKRDTQITPSEYQKTALKLLDIGK
ncbi:helix-turn-helix domain-containing protein [Maribacter sp. 2304DJ31-5]|uniref:helix-turn-helix domain-containing protein n=1 Tax=Maribacter sp. 2304DJ31-5 TaxID=3386273 RepID=UPI0039BC409C